jgi:thiamine pyrophosphokinase
MDSLEEESEAYFGTRGTRTVKIDDQESATDFGKCLVYIKNDIVPKQPGLNVVVLGGLGGRMDHAFSQVHQLFKEHKESFSENYQVGRIYLLSTESIAFVLGPDVIHRIYVKDKHDSFVLGKHVGIIPFKGKAIITTKGLKWDVEKWETEIGDEVSTSNIAEGFETSGAIAVCTTINSVLFTIDLPDKLRNVIQGAGTK